MRFTRTLGLAALLALGGLSAQAQATFQVGTAADTNTQSTYPTPFGDYYEGSRQQFLFLQSELTAAGMSAGTLTGLRWNVLNTTGSGVHEQWTIKIGTTQNTTLFSSGWLSGATTVYGPFDYQPTPGQNVFTFAAPFFWNGTSNIFVEVCHGSSTNVSGNNQWTGNAVVERSATSFASSRTHVEDNAGSLCGYTGANGFGQDQTRRPVTTFLLSATTPCSAPQSVAVPGSGITSTAAQGTWSPVAGSTGYQYAVGTDAIPPASGAFTSSTSASLTGLVPGTSYYLHVRTACSLGFSSWKSAPFTTYAAGGCASPDSVVALNVGANSATISWPATAGSAGYDWVVTPSQTPPAVFGWQPAAFGQTIGMPTWLNPSTLYYAHVRAKCASGTALSAVTTSRSFTTTAAPTGVATAATGGLFLQVTPNPARDLLHIAVGGPADASASFELLDGVGRVLRAWPATATDVSVADLPAGLYLLRYAGAARRATVRVQKL